MKQYKILFNGDIQPKFERKNVEKALLKFLKTEARVKKAFVDGIVLKDNATIEQADKIAKAFHNIGAIVQIDENKAEKQVKPIDWGTKIKCTKCKSEQINISKKGYSGGKGAAGFLLLGPIGALGGFHGKNKNLYTCQSCGYSWSDGVFTEEERKKIKRKRENPGPVVLAIQIIGVLIAVYLIYKMTIGEYF